MQKNKTEHAYWCEPVTGSGVVNCTCQQEVRVEWIDWPDNIPARRKDVSTEEFMARQFADPETKAVYERLAKR